MNGVYCTYFDQGYAPRGLTMMQSLRSVGDLSAIFAVCFDDVAHEAVEGCGIENVTAVHISEVEAEHPALRAVKTDRSRVEYYFTSTPTVVRYTVDRQQDAEWVTYLDADLYFFSHPSEVYQEQASGSVGIIEHGYSPRNRWREKFGVYNVGWVSFRRDEDGLNCLAWWQARCLEWCFDKAEDGRFADQGYLNDFAGVVESVAVIEHPGANLAPWNLSQRNVECGGRQPTVNGRRIVFFHFHGLQQRNSRWYLPHWRYGARTSECVRDALYRPYLQQLVDAESRLTRGAAGPGAGPRRRGVLTGGIKQAVVRGRARLVGDSLVV